MIDPGVQIGYPAARAVDPELTLGDGATLRSGTILYAGSRIGERFETGHNVVVREQCEIGDDVSVWSNTVIDYGCRIGAGVKIHTNCYVAQYTEIGPGAFLAPGVTIANDLYPGQAESAELMSGPSIGAGAQLGRQRHRAPVRPDRRRLPGRCRARSSPATSHPEQSPTATQPESAARSTSSQNDISVDRIQHRTRVGARRVAAPSAWRGGCEGCGAGERRCCCDGCRGG